MKKPYPLVMCMLFALATALNLQARDISSITGNSIGSSQTICNNTIPAAFTGSVPGGGTGVYSYQWQLSTTSAIAGFADVATATAQGYAAPALTATSWYRRIVTSGAEFDTTGAIQVLVTPIIVHASNTVNAAQTICYNTIPVALNGTGPTGGDGTYTYLWQQSPNNTAWSDITGSNTIGYAPAASTTTTYYRRTVFSGGCADISTSIKITVVPQITTNTITADQSICSGQTPLTLAGSTATGGSGGFIYGWQSSIAGATNGFATATGTANGKNYNPAALTQTTWYRRYVTSGTCADTSATVQVTVVSAIPGNPTVFGNNLWNVYAYGDATFTAYEGYYTENNLSFITTSRYTTAQSPSTASGYQGCQVAPTNFSVSMKRTNFTPANYQLDLTALDDNMFLFINGTQVYTKGCCTAPATPVNNIYSVTLGATDQVEIRWTQGSGPSQLGVNFTTFTPTPLLAGSVAADQSVCYGETPSAAFSSTAIPSGGCSFTGYQWQSSVDSFTWVNITGATAATYTETNPLTQTEWYRRVAKDACGDLSPTLPVKVTVNVVPPGDPSVYGSNVWNVYLYQFVAGQTAFSQATYKGYYVEPLLSFTSINRWPNGGSPSTASGYQGCYVAPTNHWVVYKRTAFTPNTYQIDIPAHDDDAYLLINGIQVFVHNGCCDVHSNVWTGPLGATDVIEYRVSQGGGGAYEALTLTPVTPAPLTGGTVTPSQTICAGNVPPTPMTQATAPTGGCTISSYQWQSSADNGTTWTNISGATAISYTATTSVYTQTLFRRTVYDLCGNSANSNADTVYMNNSAPGDPTIFGNNVWNVYCFQDINYSLYAGYYIEPLLTFSTPNRYPATTPPSTASGYQGCQLINTYYSVSMKRTGFTAGTYQIDVTSDDDYNLIYINGSLVSSLNYPTIQNNVWTGTLSPTDKIEVRWRNNAGPGQTGVRFTLVSATTLLPGTIAAYNPTLCAGDVPIINSVTLASGGCFVNYSWQSSTDGGTTWTTIAGATGTSYTAAVSPTVNTMFRRVATDVCGATANSPAVSFTQGAGSVGNPNVYGNGAWNVYAYDANGTAFSTANYLGYYTEPLLSFSSLNRWGNNNAPSDASGYQGCQVDQDNHWVSYRRTNFTPATYQLDIPTHDDDVYLFINGVQVFTHAGCCDAHTNVWTGILGATDQVELRWREYNGGSNGALTLTVVTPAAGITGGVVAVSQSICSNTTPVAFTSTALGTSNCFVYYQWQSQANCTGAWSDIATATAATYAPGALTANTCFRRKTIDACGNIAYSNTVTITIYSTTLTPGTIAATQTICAGATAAPLTSTAVPTGGDGNYVYQWQSSADNIGWSNITGATATTYAPGAITTSTYYRRNVTACGVASSASSASVLVTVNNPPAITSQPANPSACLNGSTTISVAATGSTLGYQWQVNQGSGWSNTVNGATYANSATATLTINSVTALMNGYQYRVIVSNTCSSITSGIVTLTIGSNPTISSQPVAVITCANSTVTYSVTASGTGLGYQWQQKVGAGAFINLTNTGVFSGVGTATLTLTNVPVSMNGNSYQCVITSTCGGTITTSVAGLAVLTTINNTINADQSICAGMNAGTLTGTSSAAYSYQWQTSTVSATTGFVPGSNTNNTTSYTPNPVTATTYYRRVVNNGGCSVTSNVVTVSYSPTAISVTTQPANQTLCAGSPATFSVVANGPGTLSYQWYENTGSGYVLINNGGIYSGALTATLTLSSTTAPMNGYRYLVKIFASGCTTNALNSNSALLTTNSAPVITASNADIITCAGSSIAINTTATGLGLSYQWQVNTGSGWNPISNFGAYSNANSNSLRITGTVVSMNGYQFRCVVTGTCSPFTATTAVTNLTVNPVISNNSVANSQNLCAGVPVPFTGSTPAGGDGTYSYQWAQNTGSGFVNITGATGNGYSPASVSVTTQYLRTVSSSTCGALNSIPITVTINPPTTTTDPRDTIVCAGTNASFIVTANGTGLSYQWQEKSTTGTFTNITNGIQYTGTLTATLVVHTPAIALNGYQYRVIVSGNCSPAIATSAAATLTVNPTAIITAQPTNVNTCVGSNAVFQVTATGGAATYQWQEKVGAGVYTNISNSAVYGGALTNTLTITGVTTAMNTNKYICVITVGSCPVSTSPASLTVSAMPVLVITDPATICAPGTIDITAAAITAGSTLSGGTLSYWNNVANTSSLSNPAAIPASGTFYIRVATSAVCYDDKPVHVTINPVITNNTVSAVQSVCTGSAPIALTGSAPAGGSGTYTYQWQSSTDNISFTDISGATASGYSPAALTVSTWYRRTVFSGACSLNSASIKVTVVAYPTAAIAYTGSPYCQTGTATVSLTGQTGGTYASTTGLVINATTGAVDLAASTAATYTVTYNFTNGTCASSTTASITIRALPVATIAYGGSPYCPVGNATVTLGGQTGGVYSSTTGLVIDATTGTINLATSAPTSYVVTYTFSNGGCSNTTTAPVTINSLPTLVITNPAAVCYPLTIDITKPAVTTGSGTGLSFTYFKDAATLNVLTNPTAITLSGTYYLKATSASGCTTVKPVVVTINPLPAANISYTASPYCTNGTAYVTLTGLSGGSFASTTGLSIDATTGNIDLNASAEGTYTVTYNFSNGTCGNTTSTSVVIKNPALVITDPAPVCAPGTVDLTNAAITAGSVAGLAFDYYTDASATLPVSNPTAIAASGTFYIRGTNTSTGCSSDIKSVNVTVNAKPSITAATSGTDICKGSTVTLTGTSPGNTISWLNVSNSNPVQVTPLVSTTYSAVATNSDGCADTTTVTVDVKPFVVLLAATPEPVLAGTTVTLNTSANFNYNIISWSPAIYFADQTALSQTITVKDTSKSFTVIAQSDEGCLDTASVKVNIDPNLKDFFIPNAFSPNGDGQNDLFKIYGSSIQTIELHVFNQWGELLFTSKDPQRGWDGNWKGKPQPVGPYFYEAKVFFYNNVMITRRGNINLIR